MASIKNPAWRNRAGLGATQRVGKVENDRRADWREAWALFSGDVTLGNADVRLTGQSSRKAHRQLAQEA